MKHKKIGLLLLSFIIIMIAFAGILNYINASNAQTPEVLTKSGQKNLDSLIRLKQFNNKVALKVRGSLAASPFIFISLHDDEITGQKVIATYIKTHRSASVSIENKRKRLISFRKGKKIYSFDPNRIFTQNGIQSTLRLYGAYSEAAAKITNAFAQLILQQISKARIIIAVHNNTNGNYSLLSYLKGGKFYKNASRVYRNPALDTDDFFLTTSVIMFNKLKQKGFNTVLQDNKNVTDNGSLSVYFRNSNKLYVNIEAQEGHYAVQLKMLEALMAALGNALL